MSDVLNPEHPAQAMSLRSMDCVKNKRKEEWLSLFDDDAVMQDPVGRSPLDPTGLGHRGKEAISKFWDTNIAHGEFSFAIRESFPADRECANIGSITVAMPGGMRVRTTGVFCYRLTEEGKLASIRAIWDFKDIETLPPA